MRVWTEDFSNAINTIYQCLPTNPPTRDTIDRHDSRKLGIEICSIFLYSLLYADLFRELMDSLEPGHLKHYPRYVTETICSVTGY